MNKQHNAIIKMVAKEYNTSVRNVNFEIEQAIKLAQLNPDPRIQDFWKNFPCDGQPTAIEVICYLSKLVSQ